LLAIWGRVPTPEEAVEKIDAVTTTDVRRYAGEMIEADVALALYGPVSNAPGLEEIKRGLAR
jgi:predicted Zn-dependent peptidase